jgi:hypothetical protein
VLPLLGELSEDRATREQLVGEYGLTDDYYAFETISAGGSGASDDRSFSVVIARFDDAEGAGGYFGGFHDRLAGAQLEALDFPSDAPTLGDESTAATYTTDVGGGVIRHYVDILIRMDRDLIRLRIGGPEQVGWDLVEEMASLQLACLSSGSCLDAIDPPDGLL